MKSTIPAVRAAVSLTLRKRYHMSGSEIARRLGLAQPAVSKYLSGSYSAKIKGLARFIDSKRLQRSIVAAVLAKKEREEILDMIDRVAASRILIEKALEEHT